MRADGEADSKATFETATQKTRTNDEVEEEECNDDGFQRLKADFRMRMPFFSKCFPHLHDVALVLS